MNEYIKEKLREDRDEATDKQLSLAHQIQRTEPARLGQAAGNIHKVAVDLRDKYNSLKDELDSITESIKNIIPDVQAYRQLAGLGTEVVASAAIVVQNTYKNLLGLDVAIFGKAASVAQAEAQATLLQLEKLSDALENLKQASGREEE